MFSKKLLLTLTTIASLALIAFLVLPPKAVGQEYVLTDAQRFAKLFQQYQDSLSSDILEEEYLSVGTTGVRIFTPNRIVDANNLAEKISKYREAYEKGINIMLEGAIQAEEESLEILRNIQTLFKQKKPATTYFVFGANNSGGTASGRGLVIGLEVLSRFADNTEEAREIVKAFVAHEVVHVYQARVKAVPGRNYLLTQTLKEGFADFIARRTLGYIPKSEIERHEYGMENEAVLWKEFQEEMNGTEFQPWMYGKGKDGRPSDLGYWIGLRICEAYYNKAEDKEKALLELLKLKRPKEILKESGYNPK